MIFKGTPNMYIKYNNKILLRLINKKGFYFDSEGKYKTENDYEIKYLKQVFEYEENNEPIVVQEDKNEEEKNIKKCQKCDFTCDNQGELLKHYRKEHPKSK